jgi:hypothetical protein
MELASMRSAVTVCFAQMFDHIVVSARILSVSLLPDWIMGRIFGDGPCFPELARMSCISGSVTAFFLEGKKDIHCLRYIGREGKTEQ